MTAEPTTETVRYEVRERIAVVTLDRPAVKNALGPDEWQRLDELAARAEADADVRVMLVRGAGGVFSAGGDLRTMPERLALEPHVRRARLLADAQVVRRFRAMGKPIVAEIAGAAVGAGLSLALACDVRMAATTAKLGATFHKIGLTGDFGMLWLLPRAVGPTRALDLLYSAELVDGARAEAIGLVSRAVLPERLEVEAWAYAQRLAAGPPVALAFTKRGVALSLERELAELMAWEADAQAACSRTADAREGVAAFLEKRPPVFRGR
ncbi:MAG TPA: enoyl-CoA hydratase-related protein [Polyangia bacterium]|nr:enoyl-CoA hydratase-related protein [Polyangia bacterium]